MANEYPRLPADRDVVVLRDGRPEQARLRGWLDGHDGPVPAHRIELVTRLGSYTCPYTATGPDMFEALVRLRRGFAVRPADAGVPAPLAPLAR